MAHKGSPGGREATAEGRLLGSGPAPSRNPTHHPQASKPKAPGERWATDSSACSTLDGWGNLVLNSRGALTSLEPPCRDHLLPAPQTVPAEGQGGRQIRWRAGLVLRLLLAPQNLGVQLQTSPHAFTLSSSREGETGPEEGKAKQPCPQTSGPHPRAQSFPSVLRLGEGRRREGSVWRW